MDVSKVIEGVHEKIRFRQAVFQEPETSIFFKDVDRVIRGVYEKAWFRQAIFQEPETSIFFRNVSKVMSDRNL